MSYAQSPTLHLPLRPPPAAGCLSDEVTMSDWSYPCTPSTHRTHVVDKSMPRPIIQQFKRKRRYAHRCNVGRTLRTRVQVEIIFFARRMLALSGSRLFTAIHRGWRPLPSTEALHDRRNSDFLGSMLCGSRQVFLVVEPKFEWDAGAVKRRERAVKRAKIAAAELFRTSPLDENSSESTEGRSASLF